MKAVIEKFKPVNGYEGLYEVSDYGTVRSLRSGKVRKLQKNSDGYMVLVLHNDSKRKEYKVHRLVYEAFVEPIPDGYEIDHINTIRDDNRIENLRICTHTENNRNPLSLSRRISTIKKIIQDSEWIDKVRKETRKTLNKPVFQLDKSTGNIVHEWDCIIDACRQTGIDHSCISKCCQGKRKSAGGYRWRFASDSN